MPCNRLLEVLLRGSLYVEVDALGGEMTKNIDKTYIQVKMLNTGKGPAVRALQCPSR